MTMRQRVTKQGTESRPKYVWTYDDNAVFAITYVVDNGLPCLHFEKYQYKPLTFKQVNEAHTLFHSVTRILAEKIGIKTTYLMTDNKKFAKYLMKVLNANHQENVSLIEKSHCGSMKLKSVYVLTYEYN